MLKMENKNEVEDNKRFPKYGLMISGKYNLKKILSGKEGNVTLENTQVWKASVKDHDVSIKFTPIEQFFEVEGMKLAAGQLKKNKHKVDEKKVKNILEKVDLDYLNRCKSHFAGFKNQAEFRMMGYSIITKSSFLLSEYYEEGNMIDSFDKYISKASVIEDLFMMMLSFHKSGHSFNNLNPKHIMLKYNEDNDEEFHLIDFSRMSDFAEEVINTQEPGFASLNSLNNGNMYPYDDLESLMYVIEYLITREYPSYENKEVEIEEKKELTHYSEGVRIIIKQIRSMRAGDDFVAQGIDYGENLNEAVEEIYETIYEKLLELGASLDNVVNIPDAELSKSELELVNKILLDMSSSSVFSGMIGTEEFTTYALKIKNVVKYDFTYPTKEQRLINMFLDIEE